MSRCKRPGCDEERLTRFGVTFQYCADHTSLSSIDRAAALALEGSFWPEGTPVRTRNYDGMPLHEEEQ